MWWLLLLLIVAVVVSSVCKNRLKRLGCMHACMHMIQLNVSYVWIPHMCQLTEEVGEEVSQLKRKTFTTSTEKLKEYQDAPSTSYT